MLYFLFYPTRQVKLLILIDCYWPVRIEWYTNMICPVLFPAIIHGFVKMNVICRIIIIVNPSCSTSMVIDSY